jgi:hypothetical protein
MHKKLESQTYTNIDNRTGKAGNSKKGKVGEMASSSPLCRSTAPVASLMLAAVIAGIVVGVPIPQAGAAPNARASAGADRGVSSAEGRIAKAISVKENAKLLPAGEVGLKVVETGNGYGTFNGAVVSHLTITGSNIAGTFMLKSRSGTIRGNTSASVVGPAARPVVSFSGSLLLGSGTGSFAHASGRLTVKGTIRRRNYELVEEVTGSMHL